MSSQQQQQLQKQEQNQIQEIFGRMLFSLSRLNNSELSIAQEKHKSYNAIDKELPQLEIEVEELLMTNSSALRIYSKKYGRENTLSVIKEVDRSYNLNISAPKAKFYKMKLDQSLVDDLWKVDLNISFEGGNPSTQDLINTISNVKEYVDPPDSKERDPSKTYYNNYPPQRRDNRDNSNYPSDRDYPGESDHSNPQRREDKRSNDKR